MDDAHRSWDSLRVEGEALVWPRALLPLVHRLPSSQVEPGMQLVVNICLWSK